MSDSEAKTDVADAPSVALPAPADTLHAFLAAHTVKAYCESAEILHIEASTSLEEALKKLAKAGVTEAHIYDDSTSVMFSGPDVGIVDVEDFVQLALSDKLKLPTPHGFVERLSRFFSTPDTDHRVEAAIGAATGKSPFYALTADSSLDKALKLFVSGVHHAAVFTHASEGHFIGAFTSFALLRVLQHNLKAVGPIASQPVGRLFPTGPTVVTSAPVDARTRDCFQTLLTRRYLGMPIVDAGGAVVATLSVSDIRALADASREDANAALDGHVITFVRSSGLVRPPVTVRVTDSLLTTVELILSAGTHRVYIVDSLDRPVGIITITDILRLLDGPAVIAQVPYVGDVESGPPLVKSTLASINAQAFMAEHGVPVSRVVDINIQSPVKDVLQLMAKHGVNAVAGYVDVTVDMAGLYTGGGGMSGSELPEAEKVYVGWIDSADLALMLLDHGLGAVHSTLLSALMPRDKRHSVATAVNITGRDCFWAVPLDRPMDKVLSTLSHNVHRVAVVDPANTKVILGLITQSAVFSFLAEHKALLASLSGVTMAHFVNKEEHPVISVTAAATVRDAFALMLGNKVTGVPVLDGEDGNIIANVSLADVRKLSACKDDGALEATLSSNVLEYLRRVEGGAEAASLSPLVLQLEDSLGTAVELLAESHTHRLYIVEGMKPVGIVTLGTILRAINKV